MKRPGNRSAGAVRGAQPSHRTYGKEADDPVAYKAEYIWIDGTEPTAKLRSKTKILADGGELPDLGLRRLEHQPGARQQLRLRAAAGVRRAPTRSAAATTSS